jgi:hypothetical protein
MARFVYEEGDFGYVTLVAEIGEEIPTDMALAWGTIRAASMLDYMGDRVADLAVPVQDLKRD